MEGRLRSRVARVVVFSGESCDFERLFGDF